MVFLKTSQNTKKGWSERTSFSKDDDEIYFWFWGFRYFKIEIELRPGQLKVLQWWYDLHTEVFWKVSTYYENGRCQRYDRRGRTNIKSLIKRKVDLFFFFSTEKIKGFFLRYCGIVWGCKNTRDIDDSKVVMKLQRLVFCWLLASLTIKYRDCYLL